MFAGSFPEMEMGTAEKWPVKNGNNANGRNKMPFTFPLAIGTMQAKQENRELRFQQCKKNLDSRLRVIEQNSYL